MAGYGSSDSFSRVETLYDTAQASVQRVRDLSFAPEQEPVARSWGIAEIGRWLQKSTTAIRKVEAEIGLDIERDEKGNRKYYLDDVAKLREHWGQQPKWEGERHAPIILIGNHKGGVSKSVLATHYAVNCARHGLKTLLVDMDAQATATSFFYTLPHETFELHDTVGRIFDDPEATLADSVVKTHWYGLDLIPSCLELGRVDTGLLENARPGKFDDERAVPYRMRYGLEPLRKDYDIIILDTAPNLSVSVVASLVAATGLVMPLQPSIADFSSTREFLYTLLGLMDQIDVRYTFERMVFTRVLGLRAEQPVIHFLRDRFGDVIFRHELANSAEIKSAVDVMQTIYDLDSHIGAKRTYNRAVEIVDNVCEEIRELTFPNFPTLTPPERTKLF